MRHPASRLFILFGVAVLLILSRGLTRPESRIEPPATPTAEPTAATATHQPARPPVVFLDPGHGDVDYGAVGVSSDGVDVAEKDVVLAIALRTAAYLRDAGIEAVLSRSDDRLPGATPDDYTADGERLTPEGVLSDLQRRIDLANASGARLLLSIHLNAHDDASQRGAATYFNAGRPFAEANEDFANLVQITLMRRLRAEGYTTPNLGVMPDSETEAAEFGVLPEDYDALVMLGPEVPGRLRPSQMPGALTEPLYLSNPEEARAAADPTMQDLIAHAYAEAIEVYLLENPPTS